MADKRGIINEFNTKYDDAYAVWSVFYPEAETDLKFFLGEQWNSQERQQLSQEGRSTFVFNYIRRVINMITGYQRKNRLSSVVAPVENSDQKTADQLSQLLLYVMNYGDGYRTISDCFGGGVKTGFNLMSLWVDYRDDPIDGDIKFGREPYNGFIIDPYFTKLDLSDCNYILRRKYISLDQAESLLPERVKDLRELHKIGWERDDKFTWLPYQRQPGGQDMMAYSEMWQQKWKTVSMVVDMESGEFMEWEAPEERITAFIENYPTMKIVKRPKRYIELNVIVNDQLMRTEINPYGLDEYPFVPFTAIFEPESDQWELKVQSITRSIRDPQVEANRRRSQMVDLLDSQMNSGWIAEENSVVNPRSLFQSGQGKVIWKKMGVAPNALEKIPPAQIPPSMFQLQETFNRDITEIAGVNDANFGIAESGNESGVMMMLRQGASLVNLQDVMDNLRSSQKSVSQKVLKLIQQWGQRKVERVINEKPTEQFYNKEFTKYDVVVQEGILTDTQRQMYFRQLLEIKAAGAPVTGEMLAEAAPIQGKSKYNEQLAEMEKQQAQQAQEQQQIQAQVMQSQQQMSQAKAISDIALSKERYTRAVANNSLSDERAAKAVEDRTDAALNRIKAVKEMQTIDDERLIKYLSIIKQLEEMSRKDEEKIKEADIAVASKGQEIGNQLSGFNQDQVAQQPTPEQVNQQPDSTLGGLL